MNGNIAVQGQLIDLIRKHMPILLLHQIAGVQPSVTTPARKRLIPTLFKYQFSRTKWYVAEYYWVHRAEVLDWCAESFGAHPRNPDAWSRWVNLCPYKIHFRDEKDYILFVLRWS